MARVVIAPDKFKGSLSARAVADAMARGVARSDPGLAIDCVPMADGGEGTVEALVAATRGTIYKAIVTGPLGEPVEAEFGILGDGRTGVIEMASASGLVLVPHANRNPGKTTTLGTGELVLAAIAAGSRRLIIGIGGSATNDGGAGLAQALGYALLDSDGRRIEPTGAGLARLDRIDGSKKSERLSGVEIAVACDVTNPLCGSQGASAIYGPQKGATAAQVLELDRNLVRMAEIIERDLGVSVAGVPGSGAAGGLGAGLLAFAGGKLERGVDLVIDAVGLEQRLEGACLCLTGEGSLDASSAFGKTVVGVAGLAKRKGCPTIALVGTIGPGAEGVIDAGVDAFFSICPGPMTLEATMAQAAVLVERGAEHATRSFMAGVRSHARVQRECIV